MYLHSPYFQARLAKKMELAVKPFKMRSLLVIKSICKEGMRTLHMLAKVVSEFKRRTAAQSLHL